MSKKKNDNSFAGKYYNYYEDYPQVYSYKSPKRSNFRRKLLWQSLASFAVFLTVIGVFRGNIDLGAIDKDLIRQIATQDSSLAQVAVWAEDITVAWFNDTQPASADLAGNSDVLDIPVSGKVISHFGWQKEEEVFNQGIVIETDGDYEIKAAYSGTVAEIKQEGEYYTIILSHPNDLASSYGNCAQVLVKEGQQIAKGDIIGYSGTCTVEKGRVYFALKYLGEPVDPLEYLALKEV